MLFVCTSTMVQVLDTSSAQPAATTLQRQQQQQQHWKVSECMYCMDDSYILKREDDDASVYSLLHSFVITGLREALRCSTPPLTASIRRMYVRDVALPGVYSSNYRTKRRRPSQMNTCGTQILLLALLLVPAATAAAASACCYCCCC
jgi:hypothetical protein